MKTRHINTFKLKAGIFVLFIFMVCISCNNPRKQKWHEDIDYFSAMLYEKHIDFEKIVNKKEFSRDLGKLKRKVHRLMDYEIVLELQAILAKLHIAHTNVTINYWGITHFPIYTEIFDDGLFIVGICPSRTTYLRQRIVGINDIPIDEVYEKLSTLVSYENEYWLKAEIPFHINSPEILSFCGIVNYENDIIYNLEDGRKKVFNAKKDYQDSQMIFAHELLNSTWLKNQYKNYWFKVLDDNTLYIQYNKCEEDPRYPFALFVEKIDSVFNSNPIEKLCFDLRLNTGGNSFLVDPLINRIKQQQGLTIYTLISRRTYSSGTMAALDLKDEFNALLIGEPTGGSPKSYGDIRTFSLPNSGVKVHYCVQYFSLLETDDPFIAPDIYIDYLSEEYFKGRDPVLEYVLNN